MTPMSDEEARAIREGLADGSIDADAPLPTEEVATPEQVGLSPEEVADAILNDTLDELVAERAKGKAEAEAAEPAKLTSEDVAAMSDVEVSEALKAGHLQHLL